MCSELYPGLYILEAFLYVSCSLAHFLEWVATFPLNSFWGTYISLAQCLFVYMYLLEKKKAVGIGHWYLRGWFMEFQFASQPLPSFLLNLGRIYFVHIPQCSTT